MKSQKHTVLLGLAALTGLAGCGRQENTFLPLLQSIPMEETIPSFSAAPSGEDRTDEAQNTVSSESLCEEPTPAPLDILDHVQLEAGARELSPACFFTNYEGQTLVFETPLSEEALASAGAVYEVNVTYLDRQVTVTVEIVDTTPPLIQGVTKLQVDAGDSISYKNGISLSDNAAGEVTLQIDSSQVNLNVPGIYPLYYTASDSSGNIAVEETTITVVEVPAPTEQEINTIADTLIAQLVPSEMSKYDAVYTLWTWCKTNIRYSASTTYCETQILEAHKGLTKKSGDCYTYYATFSLLLERCEIDTICVSRVGGSTQHWWNLVNVGDGWYHCDASPLRKGDPYACFMQTDAQLQAYMNLHPERPNYYSFDESLYPDRETAVIFGEDPAVPTDPEQ